MTLGSRNFRRSLVAGILVAAATALGGEPISFRNDVSAVLSKAGCNAGTCHGNKNGKGGFKLSLRGQDPEFDYLNLTRDVFGRRIDPVRPEESLVLLKPTTQVAHEGGTRFSTASLEYQILRGWLAAGITNDLKSSARLVGLQVSPAEKVLIEPSNRIQLEVRAAFSDGTTRDVTRLAVFESANTKAKVSAAGLVEARAPCESTILIRYLDQQRAVPLVFVPKRPRFQWHDPKPFNYIDEHIFAKLRTLRINPAGVCSDAVFVRRAYLDLVGLLPTREEAQQFIADKRRHKRKLLIDQLLERPEFADFWALKWADLLRVEGHSLDRKGVQNFHHWIRQSIAESKPLDRLVRELITGRGSSYTSPAANFYRPNRDPAGRAKAAAQVFLGTRLQCAECHNHPSDRWTQDDYYDWAGVFARVNYKVIENKREIGSDQHEWNGEQIIFASRKGSVTNPRSGQAARPRFLGHTNSPPAAARSAESADVLQDLAEWLTSPANNSFARVQVNRIWYHLMGRGLVDPPDDYRATNPASHPDLLDALADDFVKHGYDLRHLVRLIMNSRAYQLSAEAADPRAQDENNYSHVAMRRLGAEQLLDCQAQVAEVPLRFAGYPVGTRAAQLPGVRPESKGKRRANQLDQFLEIFGKPPRLLSSDMERSCECNMTQAFQMLSGPTVTQLLSEKTNRVTRLLAAGKSNPEILEDLFWATLTRAPAEQELEKLLPSLENAGDRRAELEDILWGLLNSKEFLFRR